MEAATDLAGIIGISTGLVNNVIVLLIGLAMLYFIWGLVQFIGNAGNEEARTTGKQHMIWGIIALFVIVAIWGLVGVIQQTFLKEGYGDKPDAPQF